MYDILFSKEALQLADKANAFKALMIQTALESLEENGKTKLKNAQGKYDYTILKNMLYKGKIVRPHRMKKELPEKKHKDEAAKAEKKPALAKREPAPKQPAPTTDPLQPAPSTAPPPTGARPCAYAESLRTHPPFSRFLSLSPCCPAPLSPSGPEPTRKEARGGTPRAAEAF